VEASNILFVLLLNRLFSSTEKQNRQRAHQAHLLETPLFDYSEAAKAVISILADVVLTLRLLQPPFLQVQGFCTLRLLQLPLLQVRKCARLCLRTRKEKVGTKFFFQELLDLIFD